MSVTVRIPTPLRSLTGGQAEVKVAAGSVGDLIAALEGQYKGIQARLCDDQGQLRRFINIYVNEEDIRFLQGPQTPLKEGDQVSIVPAIAGGRFGPTVGVR
jgi:molybdopterin synthase sulfur carrier subunit